MSKPENLQNKCQSDSDPWLKNERRAESEPGKKSECPALLINDEEWMIARKKRPSKEIFSMLICPL